MNDQLKCHEIRHLFTDYFVQKGHELIPSSSLVPGNDPTLLFTNAGMVQFKELFLGLRSVDYKRATSIQRCVRAGGKHNDLENVGYTARHHTFFEMLGNFSFGDYFKKEALEYAWDFLTNVLKISKEKLWVTVYKDDPEAKDIWINTIGFDPERITECGEKDNFWQMGDVGPCGPCSEIFYDHGPDVAGGPPGTPEEDGDRYVEIWNMVFMQYNRDSEGKLNPLPKPCVDTGMGLERVAAVLQGVSDNYHIDLFQFLLRELAKLIEVSDIENKSMRVLVDHIRASVFLIADGITPSNEGRGYVLRRIIRRAVRHGYMLGQKEPFFYRLVASVVSCMADDYPHLLSSQSLIEQVLLNEEEQFFRTLLKGIRLLDQVLSDMQLGDAISGDVIFQLYDTYGFPSDLTADIARERGFEMDMEGFNSCMNRQRLMSQRNQTFNLNQTQHLHIMGRTEFVGYDELTVTSSVIGLLQDDKPVTEIIVDQEGIILLDKTPFYAESGGQVGDQGYLHFKSGSFRVRDTQKQGDVVLHYGKMIKGSVEVDDTVTADVDQSRLSTTLNHSATHLLHEALRRVLGDHVQQKGSLVEPARLRFDFSHSTGLSAQEVQSVERLVNQQIRANHIGEIIELTPEEAKKRGALALFGERYGKVVRMVSFGDFSIELCGGTHVKRTGDIGLFKISSETACASGVRRIEAVTGEASIEYVESEERVMSSLAEQLKSSVPNLPKRVLQLLGQMKEQGRELQQLRQQLSVHQIGYLLDQAQDISGVTVLALKIDGSDRESMRVLLDRLKEKTPRCALLLAAVIEGKVQLVAGVTKNCHDFFTASDLLKHVASQIGGRGGGRPDLAQGGGDQPEHLPKALASVVPWIQERLGS